MLDAYQQLQNYKHFSYISTNWSSYVDDSDNDRFYNKLSDMVYIGVKAKMRAFKYWQNN